MIRSAYYKLRKKRSFSPYFYIKVEYLEIFRKRVGLVFIIFALLVIVYVLIQSFSVFGKTVVYSSSDIEKNISELGPKERVLGENGTLGRQISDLVYFSLKMPQRFDRANVKVTFKNTSENQNLALGFKDQQNYHFSTEIIDAPLLEGLDWESEGDNPAFYYKDFFVGNIDDFLKEPPKGAFVGVFDYDSNLLTEQNVYKVDNYSPSNSKTVIDTPLRGKVIFFVFLKKERFKLWVEKQDLNWYEDPDVVNIKIYKEKDNVYTATIDDDGIVDSSGKSLAPQEVYIENPGSELPEPGVYKVVIEAGGDSVIKKITTNLHKIVFEGGMFPVENKEVYPEIAGKTEMTRLFTNALEVSAVTSHIEATQSVVLGSKALNLTEVNKEATASAVNEATGSAGLAEIIIPKSDVIIKGSGYFAFSAEHFFEPINFKIVPITQKSDLDKVNYLITDYVAPYELDGWKVAERTFHLSSAYIDKGKLSWILKAPGLAENGNEVIIKKIEVELIQDPLINWIN